MLQKIKLGLDYNRTRLFIPKPSPFLQTFPKLYFSQFRVPLAVLYVIKCVHDTVSLLWRRELKRGFRKVTKYNNSKTFDVSCFNSRTKRSIAQV
jgi:hypothetical protein